ncbi:FAD-dependent oxidoreductase [Catellatospora citrea]
MAGTDVERVVLVTARRRVAVVGSGVSGLTAAYVLQKVCDVTLFEADDRLGGHAHTHDVAAGGRMFGVDSGFIVHNDRTYPLLRRLFSELGVATQETEMSMSVRCGGCGLEYAGAKGLYGLLARPANLTDLRFVPMLAQVRRFHRQARALLKAPAVGTEPTLGEFLAAGGYSEHFTAHFVVPLVSAVWSCGPHLVRAYPARYLFTFLANHGMLSVKGSPVWRTVVGGSRTYVDLITKQITDVRTSTPVRSLVRAGSGVQVHDLTGDAHVFDAVVVATHADQALKLLAEPTSVEREVLGAFGYARNHTVLHTDARLLPRRAAARASWNYFLPGCAPAAGDVLVSYDMDRLQRLDGGPGFVVTLNGGARLDPDAVVARMSYRHPVYTPATLVAQRRLPELDDGRIVFAGAYHGWGFHEDGCRAGVAAAARLGASW